MFAQLYGTVALLAPEERVRIKGLIINKFRGDVEILRPGLAQLEERTGIPVLGTVPYLHVDVDDEDSLAPCLDQDKARKAVDIAVGPPAPHIEFYRLLAAGEPSGSGRTVCGPSRRVGDAGPGDPTRHQEHYGGPALDAGERFGSSHFEAGRRRNAGFGRVRRLPRCWVSHLTILTVWSAGLSFGAGDGPPAVPDRV